ncbi:MAG: hypothetical protein Q9217_006640 [Psora testacea]
MEVRGLEELPTELRELIISYITRPSDLKALCFVSKRTLEVAVPYLYKDIKIPYHPEDPEWSRVTMLAQSPNLHHIRSIEIGHYHIAMNLCCKQFHQLVEKLPHNTLTRLNFGHSGRPEARDLLHLWTTQSTLQDLQFDFWFNAPPLQDLVGTERAILQNLNSLTTVEINFGGGADPDMVQQFLDSIDTSHLRTVQAVCLFGKVSEDNVVPSAGVDHLFNWLPHHLTQLSLGQINFPDHERWHLSDYRSLRRLQLADCQNVRQILNGVQTPPLRHLIMQFDRNGMRVDFDACIAFVERAKCLETLIIDNKLNSIQQEALAAALYTHRKGLHSLMVDFRPELSYMRPSWFQRLGSSTLRQLAVRLGDSPTVQLTTCASEVILGMFPKLEVFNIFHRSKIGEEQRRWTEDSVYTKITQDMADNIFEKLPESHPLQLLAFGKQFYFGDTLEAHSSPFPLRQCYIRTESQRTSAKKDDIRKAKWVDPSELRYCYPNSEILDYKSDLLAEDQN